MIKKDLYIFTDFYPYGVGETYVANEVNEYYSNFNKIFIIPVNLTGEARKIPSNCEIVNIHKHTVFGVLSIIKALPLMVAMYVSEFVATEYKAQYLKNIIFAFKKLYNAVVYSKALGSIIDKKNDQAIYYSYWFFHWALVCTIAKRKKYIDNYISRAHLGDLYERRTKIEFTQLKLKEIDKLYVISNHGKDFYRANYPKFINKVQVSYLGTAKPPTVPNKIKSQIFLIVSCSSVKTSKRVKQIFDVVCTLPFPVKWIHFGSGPLFLELQEAIKMKPDHVEIELKGFVPNSDLLKFYSEHSVDLFVNLSSAEGLPVSIMEAQSFGIPVLATDVFATKEAVISGTGVLVHENASVPEIKEALVHLKKQKDKGEINCEFILKHWNSKFNAKTNYIAFAEEIIKLNT